MANYYTLIAGRSTIAMTEQQATNLNEIISKGEDELDMHPGISVEWYRDEAWLATSSDSSTIDELSAEFLTEFGKIIEADELEHYDVGIAYTCSKCRPDSQGGEVVRIHKSGVLGYFKSVLYSDVGELRNALADLVTPFINWEVHDTVRVKTADLAKLTAEIEKLSRD